MNVALQTRPEDPAATVTPVIMVDDHPLFRRGVVQLLNDSPRFNVVADIEDGRELLPLLQQWQPQLVLLDLNMPTIGGLELLQQIRAAGLTMKVVVITASEEDDDLLQALAQGADGFLMKDTAPDELVTKLQRVMNGEVAVSDRGVTLLANSLRQNPPSAAADERHNNRIQDSASVAESAREGQRDTGSEDLNVDFTTREQQTLQLITRGLNNKLIARELGISDGTVKVYVKSLLRKLNLHSRLELAAWVHTNNYQIAPEDVPE